MHTGTRGPPTQNDLVNRDDYGLQLGSATVLRLQEGHRDLHSPAMPQQPDRLRAADLRAWHSEFTDATPIERLRPREKATCVGVVYKIRFVPGRHIEVTIEDGTGRLDALFTGRASMPGLDLGSGMRVEGMVSVEADGAAQMRNPAWWHVSDPYQ